jgi:hypothetical protein
MPVSFNERLMIFFLRPAAHAAETNATPILETQLILMTTAPASCGPRHAIPAPFA